MTTPDPDKTARVESDMRFTPRPAGNEAQFAPGSMIAARYRVAGILGKGGMGEVYRADDIKLGQTVALKFLPARLARDPILLARLHDEVRLGRQVSHPNVCRIYDIGEWDGAHFVAMEFVDGEDLARLLHRIGRLAHDKAVDIARGVAAGLAAAHAKGILHRDLKPANVMLDSHGDARITDFGLALSASEEQAGDIAGTPAYMAPEQLQGQPATVQSDLYALGLVMYELFTGRRAHASKTLPDRVRELSSEITHPSSFIRDIDPAVERVILRCLNHDPTQRPHSAREVIQALPGGGDPLAAAMAAGETPSPRAVAAAGTEGTLRPAVAWSLLGVIALAMTILFWAATKVSLVTIVDPKAPEVLSERAGAIRAKLGLPAQRFHESGWRRSIPRIASIQKGQWQKMKSGPPALWFWTREEPRPLMQNDERPAMTDSDPPQIAPGASTIAVDRAGRLVALSAVPDPSWPSRALDWRVLFAEGGLDPSRFTPAAPRSVPPSFADARVAWSGAHPDDGTPIRVEAAAFHGVPVFFRIVAPWDADRDAESRVPFASSGFTIATTTLMLTVALAGVFLAWRNFRLRRGDRQGALRVGAVIFVLAFVSTIGFAGHAFSVPHEAAIVLQALKKGLLEGVGFCMVYLALEPYVRRRWPDKLIAWTRLLAGRWRDPMVGRDILIGIAGGIGHAAIAAGWNALTRIKPVIDDLDDLGSVVRHFAYVPAAIQGGIMWGLSFMIALMLLTIVLRRRELATAGIFALMFGAFMFASRNPMLLPPFIAVSLLVTLMVARFGPLATAAFYATFSLTFTSSVPGAISWYTATCLITPAVALLIALWAFRTSLGDQSPWPQIDYS